MSHAKFFHWAVRKPNVDKLCNNIRVAGTIGYLDFSLVLLAACDSVSWSCRMWPGFKQLRLAKESVATWRRSSAGWVPERTGRLSVGVRRRHPVTIRKESLRTLSKRRVCALGYQAGAQTQQSSCYVVSCSIEPQTRAIQAIVPHMPRLTIM